MDQASRAEFQACIGGADGFNVDVGGAEDDGYSRSASRRRKE